MKAGLHVLTEKLMGHDIVKCKEMARVAHQTAKHLATGHQRHYNVLYDDAVDLIRRGTLGELHYIRAQWHRGNLPGSDSWQQPMPQIAKPTDPLARELIEQLRAYQTKLDEAEKLKNEKERTREIEKWRPLVEQAKKQIEDEVLCKPGADGKLPVETFGYVRQEVKDGSGKVVYDRPAMEELIRWRLWDRTGGGLMAELGSHQLDAASIFVAAVHGGRKQHPISVGAAANRPLFPPDRDVDDHIFCLFEFPAPGYDPKSPIDSLKKIGVQYASINGNGYGGYGETVFGTKGTLLLEREQEVMLWETAKTDGKTKVKLVDKPTADGKKKEKVPSLEVDDEGDPESAAYGQMATKDADRGYQQQLEHWAWCVRKNPDCSDPDIHPRCYPKVAMGDAVIALTTNMAAARGLRVEFKEEWFDPDDDATPERDVLGLKVKPDASKYAGAT